MKDSSKSLRVLFIVHATAWSDKCSVAKKPIQRLIARESFNQIVEVIQSRDDIRRARYLSHTGLVYEHDEITPVPFFREKLFGDSPLFPEAKAVTLVGGVLNSTGGGCLNVAFDHLIRHQRRLGLPCMITIPLWATYRSREEQAAYDDSLWGEQVIKDLAWKMLVANIPFELIADSAEPIACGNDSLIRLKISVQLGIATNT